MNRESFGIFGNYLILNRLASGGMAEIFIARPKAAAANGRILILKRILPQVTLDPEFISMFQSEIQVSLNFQHANLVQIYDFGQIDGKHYIAMEYIEGKNLRELGAKYASLNENIPVPLAVATIAQAAAGLHYAHTFKNYVTGESLNIVHRDISPQNILVSYDGNVKIIDFGIAKSDRGRADKTRVGCVKGKLHYLSPEQLLQKELDGRSDVFSLGVVLWELLTGQRLFQQEGQNELAIMESIAHCENSVVPPSLINERIPSELDPIVMRALAKDPGQRYQTAAEFQSALNLYLANYYPQFAGNQVGIEIKALFQAEIDEERKAIKALNQDAQASLQGAEASTLAEYAETPPQNPSQHTLQSQPFLRATSPGRNAPRMVAPDNASRLPPKIKEQFYIKLTFGRALALLFYAGTLLVLRLDQDQVVLNAIFGPRSVVESSASAAKKENLNAPVATAAVPNEPSQIPLEKISTNVQVTKPENAVTSGSNESKPKSFPQSNLSASGNTIPHPSLISKTWVKPSAKANAKVEIPNRTLAQIRETTRVNAGSVARSILLRIRLLVKGGSSPTSIFVNQQKLDLNKPSLQVPLNQKVLVQVMRKVGKPYTQTLIINPESSRVASAYDLNVFLY